MSISESLGVQKLATVSAGPVAYRETGDGPPVVFLHGVGANGDLWRDVAPPLGARYRCICPDFPLGSHAHPLRRDADLSLPGLARIAADFIEELSLDDVTIVANDTGGAVAQALVGRHPERIGRLVLTSCDAFEKFPPTPQKYLLLTARSKALMWLVTWTVQFTFFQRLPTAYGYATGEALDPSIMRSYTWHMHHNAGVRRDLRRMLAAVDTRFMFEASEGLQAFDKPALVIWGEDDRLFPREHGERLAELLPQGSFELIPGSRTFVPEMQPAALASRILEFLAEHPPSALDQRAKDPVLRV